MPSGRAGPLVRCPWCAGHPDYVAYHDREWGTPLFDDRRLFEFLILEGAQAGLSWLTVLRRREGYRRAFAGFDAGAVARFGEARIGRLLQDPGIIRNRLKVRAAVANARVFLGVQEEFGSFAAYQWRFVDGVAIQHRWTRLSQLPAATREAEAFSRDLRSRGMSFVGPTIMYAHMQAVGMVNDHLVGCFRHEQVRRIAARGPS